MMMTAHEVLVMDALGALKWAAGGDFSARITPVQAKALLGEREVDKSTLEMQDAAITRMGETRPFDDYEIANLRAGLEVLRAIGVDTGDWLGQILFRLPQVEREPNIPVAAQLDRVRARMRQA